METIEGVGAKTTSSLVEIFRWNCKVSKMPQLDEIASVPGISKALAEKIFETLKS